MSRLYIAPIGSDGDWVDRFEETVATPVTLPGDRPEPLADVEETRLWGTTMGERKERYFEAMEPGDPILFYADGTFFASGRVGTTLRDQEFGEEIWDSDDSGFIYTVEDYQEHSISTGEVAELLDYGDGWFPRGFMRVSETAVNALLTEYSSIEEAFQALRSTDDDGSPPWAQPKERTDEAAIEEVRVHTEIQWQLIQLGLIHGYDVHVAINDQSEEYDGEELGEDCIDELVLPGISHSVTRIIEYIDVVWLEGDAIVAMFEVESTTSIYSGILRMTDFVTRVPNIAVDMYIVAASEKEDAVRQQMERPTFETVLSPVEHSSLQYLSFADVEETYETVTEAGPLQEVF
jgi:hypothetical protein